MSCTAENKKRWRAVLFDMDGTLMDTSEGLRAGLTQAIQLAGLPPLAEEQIRYIYSAIAHQALARFYGLSQEEGRRVAHIYRELIGTRYLLQARVFDGIEELLTALRRQGYLLSTASLKRADYCRRLLADKGLLHLFHAVAGQNAQYALTKCQVVQDAARQLGVDSPEELVLIGDSPFDAEGAAQAGVDFIGVTYGFGFRGPEDLAPYPHVGCAASPAELGRLLCPDK